MKTLRLFFTSLFAGTLFLANLNAQPSPVGSILLDPLYPVVGQPLTIYVNANHFGLTTDNDQLSAWTGINTSNGNWQHNPISNWTDESIVLDRVADVNNDSVFQLVIPSIADFYNVNPSTEAVFQIDFIARGHAGAGWSGQTSDLLFEVFYSDVATNAVQATPKLPNAAKKAVVSFNINLGGKTLSSHMASNPEDSVFIYTAVNTTSGPWQHTVSPWGDVGTNPDLKLMRVSDSIYRFYYNPSINDFYGVTDPEKITQLNFVVRNGAGNAQTEDQFVQLLPNVNMSQAVNGVLTYPTYPTVDDAVFVFINANAFVNPDNNTILNPASTFTAWSGLITSESEELNPGTWEYQVNSSWGNISGDAIKFDRLNDSVQYWAVPSIADKYGVDATDETVFRLLLIARDSLNNAVGHQTNNIAVDIYGSQPTSLLGVQPASPDAFKPMVLTYNNNSEGGIADYSDTLYTHSGVYIHGGTGWNYDKSAWPNHDDASRCLQINDSVYRFFMFPSVREFYGVENSIKVDTVVIIFHNIAGNAQSSTLFIPLADTTTPVIPDAIKEQFADNSGIKVYPNPATDMLTIDLSKTKASMVNFYTVNGQLVYSENVLGKQNLSVNVATIAENVNVLIYQVITESGTVQGKLLIK
jgi:hypothetical protein